MRIPTSQLLSAGVVSAVLLLTAACGSGSSPTATPSSEVPATQSTTAAPVSPADDPFDGRRLWVDPDSKAAQAVSGLSGDDAQLVQRIAATPTAVWLTPESLPTGEVASAVRSAITSAGEELPVFVLYGIPARDCTGGHSSGGLDATAYLDWVRSIDGALTDRPVVILEPDALASAPACNLVSQREELLAAAVGILATHASVYVDAGHSSWVEPATMAQMLSVIGIERVRGFAVNVSSFGTDADERTYAEAIRADLPEAHYVIDSSRNGSGSNGEWCNPPDRALGVVPDAVQDGSGLDAHLWIKPPGESDGTCQGGPAAGTFWPERAISMAKNAGW